MRTRPPAILPDCAASSDEAQCSSFSSSQGEERGSRTERNPASRTPARRKVLTEESRNEGEGDRLVTAAAGPLAASGDSCSSDRESVTAEEDRTAAQLFPLLMHMEFDQNAVGNVR